MVAEAWPTASDLAYVVDHDDTVVHDELISVFRTHYVGLCRLALLILSDPALAEDVVQEAFLKTFAGRRRLRDPAKVQMYLRRAVVNVSRSKLRRRGIEYRANALFGVTAHERSPWDEESVTTMAVLDAIGHLPDRQRVTVLLRYYLDLPENDIAETLGTRVGTVKSQLAKARKNLERNLPAVNDD